MKKGKSVVCFDKKIISKLKKLQKGKKKNCVFTYITPTKGSKYYGKCITIISSELMSADVFALMLSTDEDIQSIMKKAEDDSLTEKEQYSLMTEAINILYKDKGVSFNSFYDYLDYLKTKASAKKYLKKYIVITQVKGA